MQTRRPLSVRDVERAFALDGFDPVPAQRSMEPAFRGAPPFDADERAPRSASALAYVFVREDRLLLPLHEVRKLDDEERETFDLIWYQGLSQQAVAGLLSTSQRTISRRWQKARRGIYELLGQRLPE